MPPYSSAWCRILSSVNSLILLSGEKSAILIGRRRRSADAANLLYNRRDTAPATFAEMEGSGIRYLRAGKSCISRQTVDGYAFDKNGDVVSDKITYVLKIVKDAAPARYKKR